MSQSPGFAWSPAWFEHFLPTREQSFSEEPNNQMTDVTTAPDISVRTTDVSEHGIAIVPSHSQRPSGAMDPPIAKRAKKAPTLSAAAWASQKEHVLQLHIEEGRPLREVREIMERDFGFIATERQYRTRLTQWGEDKKVKPAEMQAIVRKRQYRRIMETDKQPYRSEVRRKVVTEQQIGRWMRRNDVPETALYHVSPAASTPSDVKCLTMSGRSTPVQISTLPTSVLTSPHDARHNIPLQASQTPPSPTLSEVVRTPRSPFLGQSPAPVSSGSLDSFGETNPSALRSSREASSMYGSTPYLQTIFRYRTDVDIETIPARDFIGTVAVLALMTPRSAAVVEKLLTNERAHLESFAHHGSVNHVQTLIRLATIQNIQGRSQTVIATLRACLSYLKQDSRLGTICIPYLLWGLAVQYAIQNRLVQSIAVLKRSLFMMARNLEERDHETYVGVMGHLGMAYHGQWDIEKAEPILIAAHDQAVTLNSFHTLADILGTLGSIYNHNKRHLEYQQLALSTLAHVRAELGSCHEVVRNIVFYLADSYCSSEHYDESVKLLESTVRDHSIEKGESHIETVLCYQQLGNAYRLQAWWKEAERCLKLAMSIISIEFGTQHYRTITTKLYLMRLYNDMNRVDEALDLGQNAFDESRTVFGPNNDLTLHLMYELGLTYHLLNRYDGAVGLLEEMINISQHVRINNCYHLGMAVDTLSTVYTSLGRIHDIARIKALLVWKREEAKSRSQAQRAEIPGAQNWADENNFDSLFEGNYNRRANITTLPGMEMKQHVLGFRD